MPIRPVPPERLPGPLAADQGLSAADIAAQRARFGPNDIIEIPRAGWREWLRDTARDPMIWFLAVTAALFAALADYREAIVLLLALLPIAGMDAWLHRRTRASTRALASRLAATAHAIRDGVRVDIPSAELVPGDLVEIDSGEPFPADGLLVAGESLQTDESALTGEAWPVRKQPLPAGGSLPASADTLHWAFAGTRLLTGRARLRIVATGGETLYGEIVRSANTGTQARTPLQGAIAHLVAVMLAAALALCITLAVIRYAQGHGVVDAMLSALTLAIAALPEEFPVVFAFFLGVGVYRLARRQALVRRAVAVENIGRVTCICSDKTGTLTAGRLTLAHPLPAEGMTGEQLVALASLAARSDSGDPLDEALLAAGRAATDDAPRATTVIATFPFTEDRRRETAIVQGDDGSRFAVMKGAPETVFARCTGDLAGWREQVQHYAASGHKVIACAACPLAPTAAPDQEPASGFRLAGLLAFEDPLREGVQDAVANCRQAGIRVVMITGDHPLTAAAIGHDIGLGGGTPVVLSAEDNNDIAALQHADVIARAAPAQKLQLVQALQAAGEIVAVTGDGVNDVPALKAADIGIAMGERGTQGAREVSAIVLLDDNFRTLVSAIAEGRQLFRNLQLSFAWLLLVHIPFVLTAALVPLAGYPLLYLPIHVVWLELLIHPTAMLVFQDLPGGGQLAPVQRDGAARFFHRREWRVIAGGGLVLTAVVMSVYLHALGDPQHVEHARAMAISALVVAATALTAVLSGLKTRMARGMVLFSLASLVLFVQVPSLAGWLHLAPLHATDWMFTLPAGLAAAGCGWLLRRG
ncbi:MAG: cation-translocating P-type ATPase [Gammaproteobacteria bacterium]